MGKGGLSQRDVRAILAFLRANYALQDHDGFIDTAVHELPRVVPSDLTAYCEIDPLRQTSENWLDRPEVDTPGARRIWAERMLEMPIVAHYVATGDGRALRTSDFMSQREFRDTGVYCEHYRPKDVEHVLATWVPSRSLAIGVGLHRDRTDFTDRERAILELLRPHLVQAWRNAQLATRLLRDSVVGSLLAEIHPEIAIVDGRGDAVLVGERARSIIGAHFPDVQLYGGLPEPVARWARHIASSMGSADGDVPARCAPFVHDGTTGRLTVRPFVREGGLVLAVEERRSFDPERLRKLGLTTRESEVLAWVAEGKTNGDIAAILGIAPKTVEKHLEHIYERLAVPNRAAAVAAMLTAIAAAS